MSRKLTTYKRPSVADQIAAAGDIDALARARETLSQANAAGLVHASPATVREWNVRLWARVIELMEATPHQAPYIYNVTLRWPKPPELAAALEQLVAKLTAAAPSPAEQLAAAGVVIVGVTT